MGVEASDKRNQALLPLDVKAHLRLVHNQGIGLAVLNQHGQQNHKHLLLSRRQLIGGQYLPVLNELDFIALSVNLLMGVVEKAVHHVLEHHLRLRHVGSPCRVFGIAGGQQLDDLVADVHLVVQESLLQLVHLPVQLSLHTRVSQLLQEVGVQQGAVETAYHVILDALGIRGIETDVDAMKDLAGPYLAVVDICQSVYGMVDNRAFSHTVDTTQDIHVGFQFPHDMTAAPPKRLNFYSADIFCLFCHSLNGFSFIVYKFSTFFSYDNEKKRIFYWWSCRFQRRHIKKQAKKMSGLLV